MAIDGYRLSHMTLKDGIDVRAKKLKSEVFAFPRNLEAMGTQAEKAAGCGPFSNSRKQGKIKQICDALAVINTSFLSISQLSIIVWHYVVWNWLKKTCVFYMPTFENVMGSKVSEEATTALEEAQKRIDELHAKRLQEERSPRPAVRYGGRKKNVGTNGWGVDDDDDIWWCWCGQSWKLTIVWCVLLRV